MNTLIIGGTAGLGLELARKRRDAGDEVYVTGRREFDEDGLNYEQFDLAEPELSKRMGELVMRLPEVDSLVYAAGYFQDGRITDLEREEVEEMLDVGLRGLIYATQSILDKQNGMDELITITSTSQWTPRQYEPVYNAAKAGSGQYSNAMAEDGRISEVLVAGPAGMRTEFWDGVERDDLDSMLDPEWVAGQIINLREEEPHGYTFAKILREPPRVEIVETRD